jgi:DNA polymerase-3 subunit delta'
LPHALLVHGRPGLGKTVLATLFAQRLLCEGPEHGDLPCGACPACLWFSQGNHPDFRILEPAALSEPRTEEEPRKRDGETASRQIRIDQVRELRDFLAVGTHRGGLRVVVVRPAEAMNVPTANALLKSLEEPPPGTVFVLVSSAPDRLLPTIRSRCQGVAVPPASAADAVGWLRARGIGQQPEAALAYAANAPLAALEDAEERAVRDAFVADRLASGTRDAIELADACQGMAPARVIAWLQKWTVDLTLARSTGAVRYHPRHTTALRALAGSLAPDRLLRFERSLAEAAGVAQHPLNPRLVLEDVFLRYARLWETRSG